MNDPALGSNFSGPDLDRHVVVTTGAGGADQRIFPKHSGNAKRVPDAVSEPRLPSDSDRKRRRNTGEGRSPPKFSVFLGHEGVALAEPVDSGSNALYGGSQTFSHLRKGRRLFVAKKIAIDEQPKALVEMEIGFHLRERCKFVFSTRCCAVRPRFRSWSRRWRIREHCRYLRCAFSAAGLPG